MFEEKSIRFGLSPSSVDQRQVQVASLEKGRYDANTLKMLARSREELKETENRY